MRYSIASTLALAAAVSAAPQGVTSAISPSSTAPAGCSPNYSGKFQIQVVNATSSSKRDIQKVSWPGHHYDRGRARSNKASILTTFQRADLEITLQDGVLKDSQGRTGYIAANRQFQFDGPPQTGAIYTAGWSVCQNNSLAIGGNAVFYQCLSGDFYNLYDQAEAKQCSQVYIDALGGGASVTAGAPTQSADGQPGVTGAATESADGQPAVTGAASSYAGMPTQISDGQGKFSSIIVPWILLTSRAVQAPSAAATAAPVSQISDGQSMSTASYLP